MVTPQEVVVLTSHQTSTKGGPRTSGEFLDLAPFDRTIVGQPVGAAVGDQIRRSIRAVPEVAVGGVVVAPGPEGLGAVVSATQAGEVVGPGLTRWSGGVVGDLVVQVAGAG